MFKRVTYLTLVFTTFVSTAFGANLTPEQTQLIGDAVRATSQKLDQLGISDQEIISLFKKDSVFLMTEDFRAEREQLAKNDPKQFAQVVFQHTALNEKVSQMGDSKRQIYLELFGTRGVSPYYGQVSVEEFSSAAVGIGIFILVGGLGGMMSMVLESRLPGL